jgi:hypothetical protein
MTNTSPCPEAERVAVGMAIGGRGLAADQLREHVRRIYAYRSLWPTPSTPWSLISLSGWARAPGRTPTCSRHGGLRVRGYLCGRRRTTAASSCAVVRRSVASLSRCLLLGGSTCGPRAIRRRSERRAPRNLQAPEQRPPRRRSRGRYRTNSTTARRCVAWLPSRASSNHGPRVDLNRGMNGGPRFERTVVDAPAKHSGRALGRRNRWAAVRRPIAPVCSAAARETRRSPAGCAVSVRRT